jgi:hypothetical protein|tara:strand:+ start:3645 stop:3860 length:216 start_codon:yes stop_codon:yes gene_type:complete
MKNLLTCGHELSMFDDIIETSLQGHTLDGEKCVDFVTLCVNCYTDYKTDGLVLYTHNEEKMWLGITNEQTN